MKITFRRQKRTAHFAYRSQFTAKNQFPEARVHPLPPGRLCLALLVYTDAFTEPARHFVTGKCQRNRVAKFMPENALPIGWRGHLRGRAVGGNHAAETHTKKTRIVRHTEGAYAKILLFGEDFYRSALFQL